ncbi:MAG: UvrABC system protein A [Bacteroidia bacterium]|nr:MAG: UvrABC system protein A [Bacteroidia bacterium]
MPALPEAIRISGARQHTLKNVTVALPRHKLIVVCGPSGSGKTTLAFDTLYAEGFSAYVESLSTYVRQFLPRQPRPAVDKIEGLAPAVALRQNRFSSGFRSTVATLSELYPYLRLLFARVGTLYSPISGQPVQRHTLEEVLQFLLQQPSGTEIWILRPLPSSQAPSLAEALQKLAEEGHDRFVWRGTLYEWPDLPPADAPDEVYLLADRLFIDPREVALRARILETLEEVWYAHEKQVWVWIAGKGEFYFTGQLYAEGYTFREPTPELFNYLSAYGACPTCQGKGESLGLRIEAVLPNPRKSLQEGLVAPWSELDCMRPYLENFLQKAGHLVPPDLPYYRYTTQQRRLLWWGDPLQGIIGIYPSFDQELRRRTHARALFPYQGIGPCPACEGSRLHPDTRWIRIQGRSLPQVLSMTLKEFAAWLESINLPEPQRTIAAPLLQELRHRTALLLDVGLDYLTLDRPGETLSGGESQRLQLATVLGSQLTGAIYVLDEPTIGLHPRDTYQLLEVVNKLRDAPNTVVVVEHDEAFIREADYLIEMGPKSGEYGGEVVFTGTFAELLKKDTATARYFQNPPSLSPRRSTKKPAFLRIEDVCLHNLKNISVSFPVGAFSVITGVSGSGKTTLALHLLAPLVEEALQSHPTRSERNHHIYELPHYAWKCQRLLLPAKKPIQAVERLSQHTLTRNRRSIIATVAGVYDEIRTLYAWAAEREGQDLPPSFFSFNVPGGRCETCQGEGVIIKPMQFIADIRLPCPTCNGKRFQTFILEIRLADKNISEVLDMTVAEAYAFFDEGKRLFSSMRQVPAPLKRAQENILAGLRPFFELGLGYLKLGQATTELSGGEATRLRLLPYLTTDTPNPTLFIIDEPTTGLHFEDVARLAQALHKLTERGHTVIVVEHNLDLIAQADWIVDLGPEGGDAGGEVLYQGPVEGLLHHPHSYTAQALRAKYTPA